MRSEKRRDLHCERWRLAFYWARSRATYRCGSSPAMGRHWAKIHTHNHQAAPHDGGKKMRSIHHPSGALPAAQLSKPHVHDSDTASAVECTVCKPRICRRQNPRTAQARTPCGKERKFPRTPRREKVVERMHARALFTNPTNPADPPNRPWQRPPSLLTKSYTPSS